MDTRRQFAAAGAVLVLVLAACGDDSSDSGGGGGSDDAPSDEEAAELLGAEDAADGEPVRIGMVSDGATDAFDNTDELRAAGAAVEYWNNHEGGIAGRPVELVTCESTNEASAAADCANQMIENDVVGVALSQSGVADSLWEPLHAEGVPTMFLQTSTQDYLMDAESSFTIMNPLGTLLGLPLEVAEEAEIEQIAFVIIDVPQARQGIEMTGPLILDPAGVDYEVYPVAVGTADMTSQMQEVADSGAGLVHVTGNDAFCSAAFNGLDAVGYEGEVAAVSQCVTDATREAVPAEALEGTHITASLALGSDDESYEHYRAVMATYGDDVEDVENVLAMGGYSAVLSLLQAVGDPEGDVTSETVIEAMRSMPEQEVPGGGGAVYQCGGSAMEMLPAVCSNQSLRAVVGPDGGFVDFDVLDATGLVEDAL